ncbi:hypothetical protein Dsui_2573 [Azospira oryzae PS]|jgi:hypothetical protein|uniref:Uncharacterized protein n=1 Tax=Azospira oryzae (strain ATCC BAA-33 / DSM 13638 / PS) TaxID=640081 RepID=G8QN84_AZOOP|nr:hypothetical protein [Azospira oryzae]AEV26924.1 hypothetical protein Dsui_2573 [Azospira oryzae PS]
MKLTKSLYRGVQQLVNGKKNLGDLCVMLLLPLFAAVLALDVGLMALGAGLKASANCPESKNPGFDPSSLYYTNK